MADLSNKLRKGMKGILCNLIDDFDKIIRNRGKDTKDIFLDVVSDGIEVEMDRGKEALKKKIMED